MENPAVSILGFYLALTGLLGSFFLAHLGSWLTKIRGIDRKWKQYGCSKEASDYSRKVECYIEIVELEGRLPLIFAVLLTAFVIFLGVMSFYLWRSVDSPADLRTYLLVPYAVFSVIYLVTVTIELAMGYKAVGRLAGDISKTLMPTE